MTDLTTLEDALIALGEPTDGLFDCPQCNGHFRAFEIVDTSDIVGYGAPTACATCYLDWLREQQVAEEEAAEPEDAWESEVGNDYRARRVQLLEASAWTIREDSPLTLECQQLFLAARALLHRMTIDNAAPSDFTFPEMPALEYLSALEYEDRLEAFTGS